MRSRAALIELLLPCNSLEDSIDEPFGQIMCRRRITGVEEQVKPEGTGEKTNDLVGVKILPHLSSRLRSPDHLSKMLAARCNCLVIEYMEDVRMSRHHSEHVHS